MRAKISIFDIAIIGISAALLIGVQVALAVIPNIELVSLLIILYTLHFKSKTIYIIYIFAIVECLIYPFGIWCIVYLYIWTILFFIAYLFRESRSAIFWAVIGAIYGLLFGTLSSIPTFITLGISGGLSYIAAGLFYDLTHCVGNFVVILVLFKPLDLLLSKLPFIAEQKPSR